ncbi:hypothetical protein VNO80_07243 [Phaseolus coccineus]|uniref:Uncharacterized protein n=1 Tax=Phaseolus coccineus TaxID=3886 RepID=A0AAN9NQ79_PHACN
MNPQCLVGVHLMMEEVSSKRVESPLQVVEEVEEHAKNDLPLKSNYEWVDPCVVFEGNISCSYFLIVLDPKIEHGGYL